jgi:hypothetical protein
MTWFQRIEKKLLRTRGVAAFIVSTNIQERAVTVLTIALDHHETVESNTCTYEGS